MSKNTAAPRAEPPRARRPAASGKTSQGRKSRSVRPPTRSPAPSRPRRATPGENFAARQTAHQLSHRIRAGLVRGELRASADGPCTNRPHRTHAGPFQGKLLRLIRTVRPSAQPHRARAELLRGKLHKDESYCPTDGTTACRANRPRCIRAGPLRGKLRGPADCPCTDRSHRARAGSFQGKFHRHVRRPARQPNPISPAQGCSGENFTGTKVALRQTRQQSVRQPPLLHPRRAISGEISQACQTARPSAQLHRIRAGLLREKLHKPKNHGAADGLKATPRQTAQRSPTRPTILVKLRGPLDGATIIHPPVRPGQTSYARKRPPDARPSK